MPAERPSWAPQHIDLDRPNTGFITNNQQAMIDVAEQIATFKY